MTLKESLDLTMAMVLYKAEELNPPPNADKPPEGAIVVEGLVSKFWFEPTRLAQAKDTIASLIKKLPSKFNASDGGGASFLEMCMDRNGNQWGEHQQCEALLVLAIASDQGGYCMERVYWHHLPGGVPYVWLGR